MSNKNRLNISISDSKNNVLYCEKDDTKDIIVNEKNVEVIQLEDNNIKLRIKNLDIKGSMSFDDFPKVEEKIIENKYKVAKVMWNKLLKYGYAEEFNEMVDSLDITEWYSPDNGKTVFEPKVVAFNAAIMYLTSKFPKKDDK